MKKKFFLISILIINYNNSKLVKRAIRSCLLQTYKNIEILVFDDGSTDSSVKEIKKIKKNNKIKFFENININKKTKIAAFDAKNGYYFLIKKSKGNIICLLDSDDYFDKSKISIVVDQFKQFKKANFLQNLPNLKNNQNNSTLSFWPYLAPESCISFRKKFIKKFIKKNHKLQNKFGSVWLGFRLGAYAFFIDKSFLFYKKKLTHYSSHGESKKYPFFGYNWLERRMNSFEYLYLISKKKLYFKLNPDYLVTFIIIKIYKFFKK